MPVYLNRAGGFYTQGGDDPGANTSSIVDGPIAIAPYGQDDANWQSIVTCVAALVAPFHLRVTTIDPGPVAQIEIAVTASRSFDVVGQVDTVSVSPGACTVQPSSVHFVMPSEWTGADAHVVCQFAAQAIGHAAGLEFTTDCSDIMVYDVTPTCTGNDGFRDADLPCDLCICGDATTQNSFAAMTAAFGACP
ncbi:MAG: hypothetical protein K8W52_44445 [Deltaproteobacteria bacterium]|nr:hypothetical protein [Deltaproteobacteria bacterium]